MGRETVQTENRLSLISRTKYKGNGWLDPGRGMKKRLNMKEEGRSARAMLFFQILNSSRNEMMFKS